MQLFKMSVLIVSNCPCCAANINEQNRLVTEACGHAKCRQCFLLDTTQCSQCIAEQTIISNKPLSAQNLQPTGTASTVVNASHIKRNILDTGQQQFECTICCKTFKSRSQIYYHKTCANKGSKKFACSHCEKSFATKSHLAYHAGIHENKKHGCAVCGKVFNRLILLSKHNKLHQKEGQSCSECGKLYRDTLSLNAHKAKFHNGGSANVFKCQACDKQYFKKSTLRQHMLKHFAKRFVCEVCDKKFQRNSTLQRHRKRHKEHSETFECSICFRNFNDIATLTRHNKIHEGNLQYKCRHCHITTVRKDNMLRHVRNIHIGEKFQDCIEELHNTLEEVEDSNTQTDELVAGISDEPKTVANSSVIKCVGNVEPVKIPNTVTANEVIQGPRESGSSGTHKKFKKKYDPIEMYRKILISDEDECKEAGTTLASPTTEINIQKTQTTDAETTIRNQSNNISRITHWRKNFKYFYEYKD